MNHYCYYSQIKMQKLSKPYQNFSHTHILYCVSYSIAINEKKWQTVLISDIKLCYLLYFVMNSSLFGEFFYGEDRHA